MCVNLGVSLVPVVEKALHQCFWRFAECHTVYLAAELVGVNICNIFLAIMLNRPFGSSSNSISNSFVPFEHLIEAKLQCRALSVQYTYTEKRGRNASLHLLGKSSKLLVESLEARNLRKCHIPNASMFPHSIRYVSLAVDGFW